MNISIDQGVVCEKLNVTLLHVVMEVFHAELAGTSWNIVC